LPSAGPPSAAAQYMGLYLVCGYEHGRNYLVLFGMFCRYLLEMTRRSCAVPYSTFLASIVTMLTSLNASPAFRPPRLEGTLHSTPRITLRPLVPILTCMPSTYTSSTLVLLLQISVIPLLSKAGWTRVQAPALPSNFVEESVHRFDAYSQVLETP
jgi:hypothetical protein